MIDFPSCTAGDEMHNAAIGLCWQVSVQLMTEEWKLGSCGLLDPLLHEVCMLHVTFTEGLGWLLCTFVSNLGSGYKLLSCNQKDKKTVL